jgi:hypothetical protein
MKSNDYSQMLPLKETTISVVRFEEKPKRVYMHIESKALDQVAIIDLSLGDALTLGDMLHEALGIKISD